MIWPLFAAAALLSADAPRATVVVETLAGRTVAGDLVEVGPEHIALRAANGDMKLATAEIAGVTFRSKPDGGAFKPSAWIELVDGSQLVAAELTRTKGTFAWRSPFDAPGALRSSLDGRDVRAVRLQAAADSVLDRFREIVERKASGDQIVIRRGEQTIDSLSGVVREITADAVQFEVDGEIRPVPMERVFGVVFYHPAGRELKKTACVVTDKFGMTLTAAEVVLGAGKISITTPAGLEFSRPLDALERIDFAAAKRIYLGQLIPESVEWTPIVGGKPSAELAALFAPRTDRALFGGPLQLPRGEGETFAPAWPYAKGLAIHSRTKIVYRLPRAFRSFAALAGIDSRVRPAGHVRLVIDGDDKQLYAGTLSGKDSPLALALDVQGVKRLSILVDFGEDLDTADHLNLCDARLVE